MGNRRSAGQEYTKNALRSDRRAHHAVDRCGRIGWSSSFGRAFPMAPWYSRCKDIAGPCGLHQENMRPTVIVALFLCASCAIAPRAPAVIVQPLLAPQLDAQQLVPPGPGDVVRVAPGAQDYPDQPLPAGPGHPAGILVSEAEYARLAAAQSELRRRRAEVTTLTQLRTVERRGCEDVYQAQAKQIAALDAELRAPAPWSERHRFGIGIVLGVALTVGAG